MQAQSGMGRKWRRFSHKYGVVMFVAFVMVVVLALVGLLMYMLTSMNCRAH